ncbi:hypothetical protein HPB52_021558 [Rhipicephalus sanguineus]|uniref:Uncharacterized protein n=1 Tax=Rhipicephalus sanguineus TaxID=34632 RepID=A0A9D4PE37_RHISA|nr:hypothetical protein HPB52_021558 [Rhipicephalus sanguineus]
MSTDQIQEVIRKKVDPHELGVHEPEIRPGKNGVVITAISKTGLKNLETYIVNDPELCSKMQIQQPKLKRPEVKVISIEENLTPQDITRKIISQNGLKCSEEDVKIADTWAADAQPSITHSCQDARIVPSTATPKDGARLKVPNAPNAEGNTTSEKCRSEEYKSVACIEEGVDSDRTNHSMMSRVCPTYQEKKEQERAKILRQLELAEG